MHAEYLEAECLFFAEETLKHAEISGLMLDSIREIKLGLAVSSGILLPALESCPSSSTYRAIYEAQAKLLALAGLCDSVEAAVLAATPAPGQPPTDSTGKLG